MTEMQKTLKALEETLCRFQVSGGAAILMGEALKLVVQAQVLESQRLEREKGEQSDGSDH